MKIYYFYMNGCPHCIEMDNHLNNLGINPDKKIERNDIDSNYNIKVFPTLFLLDNNDNIIDRIEGLIDRKSLSSRLKIHKISESIKYEFRKRF